MIERLLEYVERHWATLMLPDEPRPVTFVQATFSRWKRSDLKGTIYFILEKRSGQPLLIAKSYPNSAAEFLKREKKTLEHLRAILPPDLRTSLPCPLMLLPIDGHLVLFESVVPGRTLTYLFDRHVFSEKRRAKQLAERFFPRVSRWLARFYLASCEEMVVADGALLNSYITPVCQEFQRNLQEMGVDWRPYGRFATALKILQGKRFPLLNSHGNLFSGNILWDEKTDRLGIVDWKFSHQTPFPLRDILCYALYTFYECFMSELLEGEVREAFQAVFLLRRSWLSNLIQAAIRHIEESLGLEEGTHEVLFPFSLMNELNFQRRFRVPTPEVPLEKLLLDTMLGE